jgi:2-dehydropantoate 2-reductase
MRFVCFGTGAIGAYIGGSLALAGHNVVFVDRPEVAASLRQCGILLEAPESDQQQTRRIENPQVVGSAAEAFKTGPYDAGILAVKSFDTPSVIDSLRLLAAGVPPVVSFQNGVENEPALAALLGAERVIPGTVTTAIGRKGPGAVVVERLRGIGISAGHPLSPALLDAAAGAGLRPRGYENPAAMKWSKLLTNLIANATSAILDMPPAQIYANPALYRIEARMLRETLHVMQAQNIPVVDLPATPVRLLAWIIARLPLGVSRALLVRSVVSGRGAKMPSFHIDLAAGRKNSEVTYLNGAVARYGKKHHTPAPVNHTLTRILTDIAAGAEAWETYAHRPEALLEKIPDE